MASSVQGGVFLAVLGVERKRHEKKRRERKREDRLCAKKQCHASLPLGFGQL
jgi:hypothetical protein